MGAPLPASPIRRWEEWPDDVRPTLQAWNKERSDGRWHLRFEINAVVAAPRPVFCCSGCGYEHYEPEFGVALLDGAPICDGCLIIVARANPLSAVDAVSPA